MSLSKITGVVSGDDSIQGLDYHELKSQGIHVPEFIETKTDNDFCFDLEEDSFASRTSFFKIDPGGKSHSFFDNTLGKYIGIQAGALNGLPTSTPDSIDMFYAVVVNFRATTANDSIVTLAGSATGSSFDGGEFLFYNAARKIVVNVRGHTNWPSVNLSELTTQGFDDASNTENVFIAVSVKQLENGECEHTLFIGAPQPIISRGIGVKEISSNKTIALGNAYNDTSDRYYAETVRMFRGLSGRGHKSDAELMAMYQRAKVVAERRGSSVF